jgi:hypothetical protein
VAFQAQEDDLTIGCGHQQRSLLAAARSGRAAGRVHGHRIPA